MTKKDLTHYQKRRFRQKHQRCSTCGELIMDNESFFLIKDKVGKLVKYSFYHVRCYSGEE